MTASRPYRSRLRDEQAESTRRRIRESARRLFEMHGFERTTVTEIAAHAGVSPQTIYSVFGGKGGIVGSMLEELEQSIGMDGWIGRTMSEPDPRRQLRLFGAFNRTMFEAGAPILRAIMAARGSADVASIAEQGAEARRHGTARLVALIASKGALRRGSASRRRQSACGS